MIRPSAVRPLAWMVAFAAIGCTSDTPEEAFVSMATVAVPAGEGSGEPFLSSAGERVHMSWLEEMGDGSHELRVASFGGMEWSEPRTVERSQGFFVNWADFPSVTQGADGTLWAHWLERGAQGGYDYAIRIVRSEDEGRSWSPPWTPHEDGTPTEHGFVSTLPMGDGMGFAWLDGRQYVDGAHGEATREMTLRFREARSDGSAGPETLLDGRVCDCCQTDAAMTAAGPLVVYRGRTHDEIRDIYVTRLVDGVWTEGVPVHHDGWEIGGCPVNGPQVAADGHDVAVAWFTGAGDVARVKAAWSTDGGASFGPAATIDDGNPVGRVDILLLSDGRALVSWLEQIGDERAAIRVRTLSRDGKVSGSHTVTESSAARASGFPRMAATGDGGVLLAWTDVSAETSRVRAARLNLEGARR